MLSNDTCGMESLVRWDDPEMGFLSPADFIGVLEKNHMIHKLDTYVINKVCYDLQNAAKENRSMVPVSVNLSRLDFQLCDIYQVIDDAINKYGIDKKMFHIEVTESTLNDDSKSLSSTIARFREDGYEVWLDDFGSDYSTLNTLQDYSFDVLKIDMNFFASFSTNEKSRIIITAVVDMAKKLKIRTVAEGIETEEEYHFLKQIGCDKAQGYYLCKPMPLELLHDILGKVETRGEKHYYDVLGRINLLSTDPLSSHRQETAMIYSLPIAIIKYSNGRMNYLTSNKEFLAALQSLGVCSLEESERIINEYQSTLREKLIRLAEKCTQSQEEESLDFIYNGDQANLRIKKIAQNGQQTAFIVTMINLSRYSNIRKNEHLENALNFLYSIYNRVDLLDVKNDVLDNIYLNSTYYISLFEGKTICEAIRDFAQKNICEEDAERFAQFYDTYTIQERMAEAGKEYLEALFRTRTREDSYIWQIYIIIRVKTNQDVSFLSCVRDINIEQVDVLR